MISLPKIFLKPTSALSGFGFLFLLTAPLIAASAGYQIEIKLPGMGDTTSFSDPGAYIRILFIFGLSLAGFLAVGAIAWAGIQYMVAGASSMTSIEKAKEQIRGALMGIILLLCAWLILSTIDPTLTNLTPTIEQLGEIEAPSPPDTAGLTQGSITPTGGREIKCKTTKICQDIQSGQLNNTLVKDLSSLPISVTVTETNGSHGCSASDSCVAGAACGSSSHCANRAADIRVSNLTSAQQQQVLQALSQNRCVDQLFYSGFPQYCRAAGQAASQSSSCARHTDHIHYSVKANCV